VVCKIFSRIEIQEVVAWEIVAELVAVLLFPRIEAVSASIPSLTFWTKPT
jgi:hypothetical protein